MPTGAPCGYRNRPVESATILPSSSISRNAGMQSTFEVVSISSVGKLIRCRCDRITPAFTGPRRDCPLENARSATRLHLIGFATFHEADAIDETASIIAVASQA
jgi:hypothetical protein